MGTSLNARGSEILCFKSSSLKYGKSLKPHKVSSLECKYFIKHVRILRNGRYVNVSGFAIISTEKKELESTCI